MYKRIMHDLNGNLSICNGTPDNITEWGYPGIHSEKYFDLTTIGILQNKIFLIYFGGCFMGWGNKYYLF